MHLHARAGCAVATLKEGLLPVNQFYFDIGKVAYHDYEGFALDHSERERLVRDLGDCKAMILRNHGTFSVGNTVADAFTSIYYLEKTCEVQIDAMGMGRELVLPSQETCEKAESQISKFGDCEKTMWPALLRLLERNGIRKHLE
ncbi:class II aldolase/adducin family protein [Dasania marina]|uniref:class II aldolase/adducin family protein n=1 Tax=Dasania marina TaxID=471499 RepID=UPI0030DAC770